MHLEGYLKQRLVAAATAAGVDVDRTAVRRLQRTFGQFPFALRSQVIDAIETLGTTGSLGSTLLLDTACTEIVERAASRKYRSYVKAKDVKEVVVKAFGDHLSMGLTVAAGEVAVPIASDATAPFFKRRFQCRVDDTVRYSYMTTPPVLAGDRVKEYGKAIVGVAVRQPPEGQVTKRDVRHFLLGTI